MATFLKICYYYYFFRACYLTRQALVETLFVRNTTQYKLKQLSYMFLFFFANKKYS